jgi:hypothetical protein
MHQSSSRYTDRIKAESHPQRDTYPDVHHARQAFHKPHTALGGVAHWVRTAGILAPLLIGEFIKDPDKRWRAVRIATVATTLISEGMYTNKVRNDRERARELHCELQA